MNKLIRIVNQGGDLSFSPNFLDAFSTQLIEYVEKAIGLDISSASSFDICILPEKMEVFDPNTGGTYIEERQILSYEEDGTAHFYAELSGPDVYSFPVRIAWKCETHANERISPDNPLNPADVFKRLTRRST